MAVHMDYGLWTMEGPRAAHAPRRSSPPSPICRGEAKRVRRIGMRRFGSTSAKMHSGMQPMGSPCLGNMRVAYRVGGR